MKVQNFKKQKNKIKYLRYIVTPKGIAERTKLTINFMRKKMAEYDQLRKELKAIKKMWTIIKFDKKKINF